MSPWPALTPHVTQARRAAPLAVGPQCHGRGRAVLGRISPRLAASPPALHKGHRQINLPTLANEPNTTLPFPTTPQRAPTWPLFGECPRPLFLRTKNASSERPLLAIFMPGSIPDHIQGVLIRTTLVSIIRHRRFLVRPPFCSNRSMGFKIHWTRVRVALITTKKS